MTVAPASSPAGPHRAEALAAIERGGAYLARFQTESGSLHGHYDGPLMLTPGYVFAHYATGTEIPDWQRAGLVRYLEQVQNADGGFGLDIEGPSKLLTTVLNYVALRLLGAESPHALAWIRERGGAAAIPTWGKYWLAIMRLYEWRGTNPLPAELWLAPARFPLHPRRIWCHGRLVYLAVSYLQGRRWQIPNDPLIASLRREIFIDAPDWERTRNLVYSGDVYIPHGRLLRLLNLMLAAIEPRVPRQLRGRALAEVIDHVEHEEVTTNFIALGPVNKPLNAVALHAAGSPHARQAIEGMSQYLFDGERGLTMQAYHSSELWNTALAVQALAAAGRTDEFMRRAHRFVVDTQVREDVPERRRYYRDPSRGGWPFSTRAHGWPTSDCTAEALAAAIMAGGLARERIIEAVDLLLWWQNPEGGWSAYERRRASPRLEALNGAEVFADFFVDRSWLELTAACLCGLTTARPLLDGYRDEEIARALRRGAEFIRREQRPDGSWEGSWGICFTYGSWFGVRGLRVVGAGPDDPALRAAARFLIDRQLPDGGWGESRESCPQREYVHHPEGSQTVMTAWALLALLEAGVDGRLDAVKRAVRFLVDRQLPDGDWPQARVTGVFSRTTMLDYRFYRSIFPIWALALATRAHEGMPVGRV